MIRKIIEIDEEKCDGCGLCADACHEAAIGIVDGKAKLLRDDYCDGLGNCLPICPTGAISFVEREAAAYDDDAVKNHLEQQQKARTELRQWPVQIKLVPINASFFDGADLLVAADCVAYARANFHDEYMRGKTTLIGCPKLDGVDYGEKLSEIIKNNNINSVTVVRMEVPCCGGIEHAAATAVKNSGKPIPCRVVTVAIDGSVVEV